MGWFLAFGRCVGCGDSFAFNPLRVPSRAALTGEREPICEPCFRRMNTLRVSRGLPAWQIAPDAYEATPEASDYE